MLKEQVVVIGFYLEELCKRKDDCVRQFYEVKMQIVNICGEIVGLNYFDMYVDEV